MGNNKILDVIAEFKRLVSVRGDAVAIEYGDRKISYRELDALSDALMDQIIKATGGKRSRIILYLGHTYNIVVSILAVLKSGNSYVPVSLKASEERKKYIVECCNAKVVITDKDFSYAENTIQLSEASSPNVENVEREYAEYKNDDEAYVLFTSGSTGEPKGCSITYGNLLYILNNMQEICPTDESSAYCFSTPYTFDVSTTEIYGWIGGGRIAVCDTTQYTSYRDFCKCVEKYKMTHLAISPSGLANMFKMYSKEDLEIVANQLQYVMVAGEEFKKSIFEKWDSENWKFRLFNLYGPTEATVYALHYELEHGMKYEKGIPLGGPLEGCNYVIEGTDESGIGELVLLGDGICSGYINNDVEMAKRFNTVPGENSYKTGDLVSFENGQLLYHGRNDDQIQINGIRVELGEIEATMLKLDEIVDVCVAINGTRLISNVCLKQGCQIDSSKLKVKLGKIMPRYMIPNYIGIVDSIPLNENRKSDRKKIVSEFLARQKKNSEKESGTVESEKIILEYMKAILEDKGGDTDITENSDFFEYGGDSLAAFSLVSKLEEHFNISLDVDVLYLNSTARALSKYIKSHASVKDDFSAEENNLSSLAKLSAETNEFLFSGVGEKIRVYRTSYLQHAYYYKNVGSVLTFDYNVGSAYCEEDIQNAIRQLMKDNSILRSKVKKQGKKLFFEEYEISDELIVPTVKLDTVKTDSYIAFIKNNYIPQVLLARYNNGFLSVFIIVKANKGYHIVGFLDHCIADAGTISVVKRKIGDYLNKKDSVRTQDYHEYIGALIENNTIEKLENNKYLADLEKYVVSDREEWLNSLANKVCKMEISNVELHSNLDYTLYVSYIASKIVAEKMNRNIATGIVYNNRDYENYDLCETIGDLHTNMIINYDQGMSFEDFKTNAMKVIDLFGKDYFQPFQAIEDDYPYLSEVQKRYMNLIVGTRVLKVDFLGQYTMDELAEKEKYMNDLGNNLNNMLNSIYATAYANMDKIFIYFNKDILDDNDKVFEFSEMIA